MSIPVEEVRIIERLRPDVARLAWSMLKRQTSIPWQAIKGNNMSLPFAFARAAIILPDRKDDGHILENETRRSCREFDALPFPDNINDYNEAVAKMYIYVFRILRFKKLITGEDDALWLYLLQQNKKMSEASHLGGDIECVHEFFTRELGLVLEEEPAHS